MAIASTIIQRIVLPIVFTLCKYRYECSAITTGVAKDKYFSITSIFIVENITLLTTFGYLNVWYLKEVVDCGYYPSYLFLFYRQRTQYAIQQ